MPNILAMPNEGAFVGLFAGTNGSGKSSAAASFAKLGKMKIYDIDKRWRGIVGSRTFLGEDVLSNIHIENVDIESGWAALDKKFDVDLIQQKTGQFPWKTILVDGASNMQQFLLADSKRLRTGNKGGRTRGAMEFNVPDDYNYSSAGFYGFFYEYALKLQCNFILTSWIVDVYDKPPGDDNTYKNSVKVGEKMNLTDKLSQQVPGYFDEIYTFSKEDAAGGGAIHKVSFSGSLAKTTYPELRKRKTLNFTEKSFFEEWNAITHKFPPSAFLPVEKK